MTHNTTALSRIVKRVTLRANDTAKAARRANEIARTFNRIASRNDKQRRIA